MSTLRDPGQDGLRRLAPPVADLRRARIAGRAAPAVGSTPPEAGEEVGLLRGFVIGSLIGFVVVFVLFGGLTLAVGMGVGAALGVGAFTALWGGPGFGGMMGVVLHQSRAEGA